MIQQLISVLRTYDNPRLWGKNISWRLPSTISKIDVVFVCGAPRSGTTLLQRILSIHSQLFSIQGETGLFSYRNIFNPRRKLFHLPDIQRDKLIEESIDIVNFFENSIRFLSNQNEGKRFVEKTPQHVLYLPFIIKHFPQSKIIHIVRDGRDCYCSSKSHPNIPQNKSVSTFAKYWKKCVRAPIRCKNSNNVLTVSYEQLASEPRTCLPVIMSFIGLNAEEPQFSTSRIGADRRAERLEFRRLREPISATSVGRWKAELTESEVCEFEKIACNELAYYGYDPTYSSSGRAKGTLL